MTTNRCIIRTACCLIDAAAGQPWLVNRLGTILTVNIKPGTIEPIDSQDVEKAIQFLLLERNDH